MSDRVVQLAPNLWRWTTPSPHWRSGDDADVGGWPRDVASHLYVADATATIVDPQVGVEDPELWAFLDQHAGSAGRVVVALTASWHRRSSAAVVERYGGEIRLHRFAADDTVTRDLEHVRPFDADGEIAPRVEALLIGGYDSGEVVYWLAEHGALIAGEVFHGRPDGLRIAPDPYLVSHDSLYAWIRHLDQLPVVLVLPAHGPPAADGEDVIRRALARPPWARPGSG